MFYRPGDNYYSEFTTFNVGGAVDADSLPTATANCNGTDDGSFALTVTKIDTGRYKVTGTIPATYVSGNIVNVTVSATISTIVNKKRIDVFRIMVEYVLPFRGRM